MKIFYERNLPHYQPLNGMFHVVFRLAGSLPLEAVKELQKEKEQAKSKITGIENIKMKYEAYYAHQTEYFEKFDMLLDKASHGPTWLAQPAIAQLVAEALHKHDGKEYELFAFSVMSNHVHVVFQLLPVEEGSSLSPSAKRTKVRSTTSEYPVTDSLRLVKGATAHDANKMLARSGAFWQHESYDHVIRNGVELERTIWYVLNNPVKAGLVDSWQQWRWTYVREGFV